MKLVLAVVSAACLTLALAGAPAVAQEAIATAKGGAPPAATVPEAAVESDDAWAKRTLDAATAKPAAKAAPGASCGAARTDSKTSAQTDAKADTRPHGEVWAGIGTRGYRNVGGVVTQPLGACGTVTLMVDHTEADGYRGGRR